MRPRPRDLIPPPEMRGPGSREPRKVRGAKPPPWNGRPFEVRGKRFVCNYVREDGRWRPLIPSRDMGDILRHAYNDTYLETLTYGASPFLGLLRRKAAR